MKIKKNKLGVEIKIYYVLNMLDFIGLFKIIWIVNINNFLYCLIDYLFN